MRRMEWDASKNACAHTESSTSGKMKSENTRLPHNLTFDEVVKYSATAKFHIIIIMLSLVLVMSFSIVVIDINVVYLLSGVIKRHIYIRPPSDVIGTRGMIWTLARLLHGTTEAHRKWKKVIEAWIIEKAGLAKVFGVSQIFIKRNDMGEVTILVAKIKYDILMGGGTRTDDGIRIADQRKNIRAKVIYWWHSPPQRVQVIEDCGRRCENDDARVYDSHPPNPYYTVTKEAARRTGDWNWNISIQITIRRILIELGRERDVASSRIRRISLETTHTTF